MADEPIAYEADLTDLTPDSNNGNLGTQRGQKLIQDSIRKDGLGRGIVIDAHGNVVAGNKSLENAVDVGLTKAIVVDTEGDTLVVTRRTDWDLYEDVAPRRYAWRDNKSAVESIDFDPEAVARDLAAGVDLSGVFSEVELQGMIDGLPDDDEWSALFDTLPDGEKSPFTQMTFTLHDTQIDEVKNALRIAKSLGSFETENENSNGNALARICEAFITDHGQS